MTTDAVLRFAAELGLDAVGVARAEAYDETERHIRERRSRGLFGSMRFTTARPEVSCHPESLLEGARTVVSAALCYWAPEAELGPGQGRLARYTWDDGYALLRERLDALGRALGGDYRVLVDSNAHVDREAAARAGVGFYGKNTMLITRRHGSWVVLGTLVTTAELEPTRAARRRVRLVHALHRRLPDRSARRARRPRRHEVPLVVDPGAAADPARATARRSARRRTAATSARTSARGTAASRSAGPTGRRAATATSTSSSGWSATAASSLAELDRLYVPRNDARWLRRNALVALGNVGTREHEPVLRLYAQGEDELLREHAEWALEELERRCA